MDSKILFSIIILLTISTGSIFAQEPLISVQTDDNNYDEGDIVVVSGNVITVIGETPVILRIFTEGNWVSIAQLTVAQDGSFTKTFPAEGSLWNKSGNYTIIASYQEHKIETGFSYTLKSEAITTTETYDVDAGSHGTFDVEYTIKGGTVKNMIVDSESFAVIVQINATDEGTITLDLPRKFIGAEKQNGEDDRFIILIDDIDVAYQKSVVNLDSRVITIDFEEGDSEIAIIGTYVVPEFATIVMVILVVGIMITMVASRNKLQIKI